ncbi:MAG: LysR family transcriptional regulator [Candidatus Paracaedibacteraceae bacterium]|nr:LysR family transcriptional regulator [Candidatus Paracaedibacteraceae bacterium]
MVDIRLLSTKVDWDKLRIFNHVAWSGSLTKASEKLALSQSAVSRQISALEAMMGCRLFRRHPRGLMLTEQGDILFETTQEIFGRISNTLSILKDTKDMAAGHLRIATTQTFSNFWLAPRIHKFLALYPEVRLTQIISDDDTNLLQEGSDLAIKSTPSVQLRMIQRPLMTFKRGIYASETYLEKNGEPTKLEELVHHQLIVFGEDTNSLENTNILLYLGLTEDSPKRVPYLSVNSNLTIATAVTNHVGIAVMDEYIAEKHPNLRRILTAEKLPDLTYYLEYPEELRRSKKIAAFRDFIMENI